MSNHNSHTLSHYHYGHYLGNEEGLPDSTAVNQANAQANLPANQGGGWEQYFPLIYQSLYGKSAEEQAALYRAQIQNLQEMKKVTPGLASFYDMQIRRKQALLSALSAQEYEQRETRVFSSIYKVGGVLLLGSLIAFSVSLTVATIRISKDRKGARNVRL